MIFLVSYPLNACLSHFIVHSAIAKKLSVSPGRENKLENKLYQTVSEPSFPPIILFMLALVLKFFDLCL